MAINTLIKTRSFKRGDETQIVRLLNTCFGDWGSVQKWNARYLRYPNFDEKDVFIIEKDGEIIGHEALHFKDLLLDNKFAVPTVTLSDAAVHPNYRGQGLHNKLLVFMLQEAKSRGAGLVFSWYLRDSGLHKHSKKMGFSEVKQPPAYMKIIRPEKLLRTGLLDFLHKSPGLEEKFDELSYDLYFGFGEATFSMAELLDKRSQNTQKERKIQVVFNEDSLRSLIKFRNMTKRQRLFSLVSLLVLRRAKIKFGSFAAFMSLARKGLSVFGSI